MGSAPYWLKCRRCLADLFARSVSERAAAAMKLTRTGREKPAIITRGKQHWTGHGSSRRDTKVQREVCCSRGHTFWTHHVAAARLPVASDTPLTVRGTDGG